MIAAAAVKINKMADGRFPRWEGKQGEFLLIGLPILDVINRFIYWLRSSYLLCITVENTKRVSKYSYTKYWTRKLFLQCHPWWQGLQWLVLKRNMNLLWSKSAKASPTRDRKTSCNIVTSTSCRKPKNPLTLFGCCMTQLETMSFYVL